MITLIRKILSIPVGLSWLLLWAVAANIFIGNGKGDQDTMITLIIMGFIALWLARAIYPDKDGQVPPPELFDDSPDEDSWAEDIDWMEQSSVPQVRRPQTAPQAPKSSAHLEILEALGSSHAQRKASKTYENIDQIPGSTNQLFDEGRELLALGKSMTAADSEAERTGYRMKQIASKLKAVVETMALRLDGATDLGDRDSERYLTLIDEISDVAADLGFESGRLLDLDETPDW